MCISKYFCFHIMSHLLYRRSWQESINQHVAVDEDPSLMLQFGWYGWCFSGFWLTWHFTSWVLNVFFFFFTILALLECFRNVPILTSRGDLPKCQSELIWMIFIAVPQGLQLLACCFFGCHILMGDNILTGVGRAWFWMSQVTCHQGLHSEV